MQHPLSMPVPAVTLNTSGRVKYTTESERHGAREAGWSIREFIRAPSKSRIRYGVVNAASTSNLALHENGTRTRKHAAPPRQGWSWQCLGDFGERDGEKPSRTT